MRILKNSLLIVITLIAFVGCKTIEKKASSTKTLKNAYQDAFYIGTAVNSFQIEETDPVMASIIANEFNSITAENIMKSIIIHPQEDMYDFKLADALVALGEKNKMLIHGHTLVWHSQLSPWFLEKKDSIAMTSALEKHINTIVTRYKGKIGSWDVVNEALNEDGTLRKSVFLDALGEDYLELAFKLASKADPNTDLYYNDYNMCNTEKRQGAIRLVKNIQNKGIKIDGIGMQGHWSLDKPTIEDIEKSIIEYASLGVKVAITELDINVLPSPWELVGAEISQRFENNERMNPYPESLPETVQLQLAKRYQDIFKLFLKHQDKISRVTFWGVNDAQSWLNDWPIEGRTNYPLLFDKQLKPKSAYDSIMSLKK